MPEPAPVRFGAFELDLHTGELRKHGIRLKLQEQPFQVLRTLVERAGELVTREEIQRRVWGDNTFVDFDQSLNRAISKVRDALGDTAENPRYIETMARRGYRFIGQVEGEQKEPERAPTAAVRHWGKIAGAAAGVLLVLGSGVWLVRDRIPAPPPRLVPLTTYAGDEAFPAFSPDGRSVAFAWNGEAQDNWDLYVKMVGTVTPLRLTSDPALDWMPAWSPDGQQIAFGSSRDGGGTYVVSPSGGPQRKVAELRAASPPAWTADGKHLVVATSRDEKVKSGDGTLWLVAVEGGGTPRPFLAPTGGTWYNYPAVAPNGKALAFASCVGLVRGANCCLQVVDLQAGPVSAGSPRQIAQPGSLIAGVTWTPDGESVIYSAGGSVTSKSLWRVNVRGGKEPERLELAGVGAYTPGTDFKTSRLAFSRRLSSAGLWRLDQDGKTVPFLPASSTTDSSPQYSPDGRHVAFNSDRQVGNMAVWVANADGTGAAQITSIASPQSGTPRWSPDGRWLAFDALRESGGWDIWVVAASGSSARQLTQERGFSVMPSWSRDGSRIYYASNRSGRFEIWSVPAGGGPARQVTKGGGHAAFESTDGKTLYYTLRDSGAEGLYAKVLPDGEEKRVIQDGIAQRGFAVFPDGVFYLHSPGGNSHEIRFHPFAGGLARVVGKIKGTLHIGFTVSPDRKTFVFTKYSDAGSDLMLIENFR